MDRDLHSEQPNVGYLRTYRSKSDLAYSCNRAMGIAMIAHRRPYLVGRGPTHRSGHAQLGRPTKRCGNCVTARRLLINSAQTFHHTSRWNLSIMSSFLFKKGRTTAAQYLGQANYIHSLSSATSFKGHAGGR